MSGKFQKFNFRKLVFKKRKDRKFSQESITLLTKDKPALKTALHRRQLNWSDGDISVRRRGAIAAGADSGSSGNRHRPKFDRSRGSKKGVNVRDVGLNSVLSSVVDVNQVSKRRSKTEEPKPRSIIEEPLSYVDSMPRHLKEATWAAVNTSPFVYQKSVSTPCMGMKKNIKPTPDFDGMAVGWPNLRSWDVPGPKARFPASGVVGPVHVPSNSNINSISVSWNNMTQGVANKTPPLSSDNRTAITNKAKKLFALKIMTGEIWNPEPTSAPHHIVEQEFSDHSQPSRLNPMISKRPASQKDFFQDKARKSLVDMVKKVASSHSQPANQTMKLRAQTNLERDKINFSKQIRPPSLAASRSYSETNNLNLTKLKNSEHKIPRYRRPEQQMDKELNATKVPENTVPIPGKVPVTVTAYKGSNNKKMLNVSGPSPLQAAKIEQKNLPKSSIANPSLFEKGRNPDAWHIRKVSDFVWKKLKQMSELASSNLKQASETTGENFGKDLGSENLKVKKVSEQNPKSVPDVTNPNIKHVQDLPGQDLNNVTEFARPLPKYVYELERPITKNMPEFPRPIPKNVTDYPNLNMKNMSGTIFEKEKGFVWSNMSKLPKYTDPNLKVFEVTETAIRKFPYFEVVNIKKEHDFVLPNMKKEFKIMRPRMCNQSDCSEMIIKKESKFSESNPNTMPIFSEPLPVKAPSPTTVPKQETFPNEKEPNIIKGHNFAAMNVKKESEQAGPTIEKSLNLEASEDEQVQVIAEPIAENVPNFAEPNLKKRSELARQILNKAPKTEKLADPAETIVEQASDISEPNIKKDPELKLKNMPEHSEPNLSNGTESTMKRIIKVSDIEETHPEKTSDMDGTKLENIPELDHLNLKKLPISLPPIKQAVPNLYFNKASKIPSKSKLGLLKVYPPVTSDKENDSVLHTLNDTTTQITNNVSGETLNNMANVSAEIENKPPDSRQQELETSWKIYVVHNAQGKGSNPGSSQEQNASGSLTGTEVPSKPTNYSPESLSNKAWKKMSNSSQKLQSTSNGCTESLITTRKLKSHNLQNYPPPQMFNRIERGENKFLVFWKGREDSNIFSNPNKKQSLLITPQSPRKHFSQSGVKSQKSTVKSGTSEDESLSRKKSSGNVIRVKSVSCMPAQDCSNPAKSLNDESNFLPVVCVPSENLPCVVSNSNSSIQNDVPEKFE